LRFVGHKHNNVAEALYGSLEDHVYGKLPLDEFLTKLTVKDIKSVSKIHGVHVPSKPRADDVAAVFKDHSCPCCESYVSIFTLHSTKSNAVKCKQWYSGLDTSQKKQKQERQGKSGVSNDQRRRKEKRATEQSKPPEFPPPPPSKDLQEVIAQSWCEDMSPENFMEGGCAVCVGN
jgi:hypothetical protein